MELIIIAASSLNDIRKEKKMFFVPSEARCLMQNQCFHDSCCHLAGFSLPDKKPLIQTDQNLS